MWLKTKGRRVDILLVMVLLTLSLTGANNTYAFPYWPATYNNGHPVNAVLGGCFCQSKS